jgi:hypothetical protein
MKEVMLKELKEGEYFKFNETTKVVWVRGYYERSLKRYECYKFDDVNHESFFKGDRRVFVGFEF